MKALGLTAFQKGAFRVTNDFSSIRYIGPNKALQKMYAATYWVAFKSYICAHCNLARARALSGTDDFS